jgi:type VI secretion system secreted protein VgrG
MSQGIYQLENEHLPAGAVTLASFVGTEAMSESYRFEIVCRAHLGGDQLAVLEDKMPGTRASLRMVTSGDGARHVHGVVTEVDFVRSLADGGVELAVRIEPRLALIALNLHSRIYQELSVVEVARRLLDSWSIAHEAKLKHAYRKRAYLTQYQETDYDFLRRILAGEGIFFYFVHGAPEGDQPAEERLVLCDDAALYGAIDGDGAVRFASEGDGLGATQLTEHVSAFGRSRRLRPKRALVGDYDFNNPGLPLRANAETELEEVAVGAEQLRMYHHGWDAEIEGASGNAALDKQRARAVLDGHRAESLLASGQSNARRLVVGHVFRLEGHPLDHVSGAYAVTRIEHRGSVPEVVGQGAPIYENRFECVPEAVPFRPPPLLAARRRQTSETATVVGAGKDEIFTDDLGRIKVKFHWDLATAEDDTCSCWLRVAQPWASTHFGAQFIPRVGDEVLVTFVGGDPDRPLVSGSLYNGTHPTPFALPDDKTVSGLRTQSTPGGGGFNELSFDDKLGQERVYLRAERDLVEEVRQDQRTMVTRNQSITVQADQVVAVAKRQTTAIGGDQTVTISGSHNLSAAGSGTLSFVGDVDMTIGQQLTQKLLGRELKEVKLASSETYADDRVTRVLGHRTIVVGQHDARRAYNLHVEGAASQYSSGSTLISSDKDIEIRVGESAIRITPEGIELLAKKVRIDSEEVEVRAEETIALEAKEQSTVKSKKILMQSESAFIGLSKVAKLNGQSVKLNCSDDPVDELKEPEKPKLTTIVLADEKGKPLGKQRFVLVLPDGSEQTGTLDEEGKAELELDESGQVIFPDVHNPRPA